MSGPRETRGEVAVVWRCAAGEDRASPFIRRVGGRGGGLASTCTTGTIWDYLESQHQQPHVHQRKSRSKEKQLEISLPTSALVTVRSQKRPTLRAPIGTREPFL